MTTNRVKTITAAVTLTMATMMRKNKNMMMMKKRRRRIEEATKTTMEVAATLGSLRLTLRAACGW
jgi:hypothetical protein